MILNASMRLLNETLTGCTTPSQSGTSNKGALNTPLRSRTLAIPSDRV